MPPPQASLEANQTLLPAGLCKGNGPKVCVELKPKCGFLPTAATIVPDHRRLKTSNSRYVLHQRLTLQQVCARRPCASRCVHYAGIDPPCTTYQTGPCARLYAAEQPCSGTYADIVTGDSMPGRLSVVNLITHRADAGRHHAAERL